jgi:hypothetical protein
MKGNWLIFEPLSPGVNRLGEHVLPFRLGRKISNAIIVYIGNPQLSVHAAHKDTFHDRVQAADSSNNDGRVERIFIFSRAQTLKSQAQRVKVLTRNGIEPRQI